MGLNKYKLTDNLSSLPGVGPKIEKLFEGINVKNIQDLLFYFPRHYKDYRNTKKISEILENEEVTIKGEIISSSLIRARTKIYEVVIKDDLAQLKIIWFNPFYRYLKDNFVIGNFAIISGKAVKGRSSKYLQIINPKPENINIIGKDEKLGNFGKISPIYPLTKGLTQNRIINILNFSLTNTELQSLDFFSEDIIKEFNLCSISESILGIHQPQRLKKEELVDTESSESVYESIPHRAFIFFEFLILCLGIKYKQNSKDRNIGISHSTTQNEGLFSRILSNLPFSLTNSQVNVLEEIRRDMSSTIQMSRLLQGDVGSGKTIVGLLSMARSYDNGYQSVLIAPTEILADQHYLFLKNYVDIEELVILKSSIGKIEKGKVKEKIISGSAKFIVGTHSLFQEDVEYRKLGMVVIDEQHRFGVVQRKLMSEKGENPDVLVMTATPIPRTLSNIFFTDYKISKIDEMPTNRGEISTKIVSINDSDKVYSFLVNELKNDRQAFILCPLISKSDNEEFEFLEDVKSLNLRLKKGRLKDFNLGVIHGKLSADEKESVMKKFRSKKIDVLICTTVIEVGVDIPNASTMIIYNPERFGLSQLHQLRGRIGRGPYKSTCILLVDQLSEVSKERLLIFKNNIDGFIISEKDMEIRGPGAFYGAGSEQSGKFWDLHLANLRRDFSILKEARLCSLNIEQYSFYKKNKDCFNSLILSMWGEKLNLTKII
ncbi:ATP-dependent DNA helicase RecG [bacterium]|jgi:ATP-dependent DNA helicase RecG|nr:ATP-dependent DNA helicase RecG [bacterium]MBT3795724.1 ATP-dependent DNA helicase RecG [bacterium]MBT4633924.1 ATP-dependent DNA helicase RecG [bacterium]